MNTFGIMEDKGRIINDAGALSQRRAFWTSLCATIGTGNIAGVATAICLGGPGAMFWMWIAAFFGMMVKYSENLLGMYYRRRNTDGAWSGGPMYYLEDGLGSLKHCKRLGKVLGVLFCIFTMLASFGIGNMAQINKITINVQATFLAGNEFGTYRGISNVNLAIGIALMVATAVIILGGFRRVSAVSETLVPYMSVAYVAGYLLVIVMNLGGIPEVFRSIFRFALGPTAIKGAVTGTSVQLTFNTIKNGCKRGVFSNEAGLGSSVMVHSTSCAREPVRQGMWGIAEVFLDTMIICTITGLVILNSGAIDLQTGMAKEGVTAGKIYRFLFVGLVVFGAIMESNLAWDISDTFNGLMMIPNLVAIIAQIPLIIKLTGNYIDRKIKGKDIEPMLSYDPDIQNEACRAVKKGAD